MWKTWIITLAFTIVGCQSARLGCYSDTLGWTNGQNTLAKNSPERCRNLCAGFKYAGLKAGNVCMCGDLTPNSRSTRSDCNDMCEGDSTASCGGQSSVEVFDVKDATTGDVSLISIGCFKDNITHRVWPNGKNNLQYNNPKLCKKLCTGFKYAGLELGIECFCGDTIPPTRLHSSYCDQKCTGDNSITCGGDRAMEVYEIRDAKTFDTVSPVYKGCFTKSAYGIPFGHNKRNILDHNSPTLCQRLCATSYRYFALEDGNICLCDDEPPKSIDDPSVCNIPCPGNNKITCGGYSALDAYEIVPPAIPEISTTTSLGCFKDNITARVWNTGLNRLEKNTPTLCNSLCSGFKYAGVQLGIECFCGDTIPPAKRHQKYCDQQCTGDDSITCGGDRAMEVYPVMANIPGVKVPAHLGCFTKGYYGFPFKNISRTLSNNKPDTCLQTCAKYQYFALFDGNECECGYVLPNLRSELCNVPCPGDATVTCGGTYDMDIYEIVTSVPDEDDTKSIGCFQDDLTNRVWPNGLNRLQNNKPDLCKNLCKGFRYAGVQIGNECFCGNTVPVMKIPQSRCSLPCPGDSSITCGGDQAMEVYKVKTDIVTKTNHEDSGSVGCFEDSRERVWKNGINRLSKNSPTTCKNLCTGYKFFGLELGTDCLCGNTLPTKRLVASRCSMECKGDRALNCGGSWAINVYETTPIEIDCGKRSSSFAAVPNVANGVISKITKFPWHVGIYHINVMRSFDQICGGTMITAKHIVSAAHCFYDDLKRLKDKRDFKVAAGKEKKDWKFEDLKIQRRDVADIFAPPLFMSREDYFFEFDISVLRVTESFVINLSVNIACMDWKNLYESEQLKNGNLGSVCGWGLTEEDRPSNILRSAQIPAVSRESCLTQVNPDFRPFISTDKFCGGFINQSIGVCPGDSGGGYVFPRRSDDGVERFYLRGIVSLGQTGESHSLQYCNNQQLSSFTLVSSYLKEIKKFITA